MRQVDNTTTSTLAATTLMRAFGCAVLRRRSETTQCRTQAIARSAILLLELIGVKHVDECAEPSYSNDSDSYEWKAHEIRIGSEQALLGFATADVTQFLSLWRASCD